MGKSRKKKLKSKKETIVPENTSKNIPIENLPDKFLWMQLKCGTKMRNVLKYAIQQFSNYGHIIWTANGSAISKAISCAEIFKKAHKDLHQLTKLRYIKNVNNKADSEHKKSSLVPEIHILLSKIPTNTSDPGYQWPGDVGNFSITDDSLCSTSNNSVSIEPNKKESTLSVKKFETMGLRMGQKRPKQDYVDAPLNKLKRKSPEK